MQPSQLEIQREVEALRDIRRRSTTQGGPGALIDPDLPTASSPTSPKAAYWTASPTSTATTPALTDGESSSSHESSGSHSSGGDPADDPFHLFWVPANVHPEIAPAEFREFLKEHARAMPADGAAVERSSSIGTLHSASSLGRKRSMLSKQYRPREGDGVEDERVVPLRRNRSSIYGDAGPQLTINDLQRLEELAEEASESDDPSKLRSVLRRSLSLNVAPSAVDKMDESGDMGEDMDSPIIVPRPGQILRRAARTKIRKASLPGDGGGHRFGSSRRGRTGTAPAVPELRLSGDAKSTSDHGHEPEPAPMEEAPRPRARTFSNESVKDGVHSVIRPESFSEEALIYDAYMQDEPDERDDTATPVAIVTPPPQPIVAPQPQTIDATPSGLGQQPVLYHPQPQRLLSPPLTSQSPSSSRSPSPERDTPTPPGGQPPYTQRSPVPDQPSSFLSTSPTSPQPQRKEKEKDKKGLFGFGGGKSSKKGGKEKDRSENRLSAEKEKDSGFFGSLFGAKKKHEEGTPQTLGHGASGRETAAALLGASKSRGPTPSPSPGLVGTNGSYARYPIHVERAIYRLSHIKLANPRRPLYEQVLISNLMFWYLGVINKTQPTAATNAPANATATAGASATAATGSEQEQQEREQKEREAEKERLEQEEAARQQAEAQKKEAPPRRGPLTKPVSTGNLAGGRRAAEMPVRGPQYEMQHRVMEQEYGYAAQPGPQYPAAPTSPQQRGPSSAPQPVQNKYYYGRPTSAEQSHLPPGAMPPVSVEQNSWRSPPASPQPGLRKQSTSPPAAGPTSPPPRGGPPSPSPGSPGPRRSRSPPPPMNQDRYSPVPVPMPDKHSGAASPQPRPGRSLSATAVPPAHQQHHHQANGRPSRKVMSAHAVAPSNGRRGGDQVLGHSQASTDEDLPLALWQQQQALYAQEDQKQRGYRR